MAKLTHREVMAYQKLLNQLKEQLEDLNQRCVHLDDTVKQTENHCFVFEVHIFSKRSLSLVGYIEQIQKTYDSLENAINKQLSESLVKHECERYLGQFQVLLKLVQGLEKGDAKLFTNHIHRLKSKYTSNYKSSINMSIAC